jgi:Uma2 family endonuclease
MTTAARHSGSMTLEEFLKLPDEKPYREFIDGRIEVKVSPEFKHGRLQGLLFDVLNRFASKTRAGFVIPELRCTFAGRSIVPDLVFLKAENIQIDVNGEYESIVRIPPDIHIEILSPGQSAASTRKKLKHSTAHGTTIGWFIFPKDRMIEVYRGGELSQTLKIGDVLDAEPVLPGFKLAVEEIFAWLKP